MAKPNNPLSISDEMIINRIYVIRGLKVMLDKDLAELYHVETRVFNQAVKRNLNRFPEDFMFQLAKEEFDNLRSQFVTSSWGGTRYLPMAFTEQGVAMLSSILNSERAMEVNIQTIRLFTKMRGMLLTNRDILLKLEQLEMSVGKHDEDIKVIFNYLRQMLDPPQPPRRRIGFIRDEHW